MSAGVRDDLLSSELVADPHPAFAVLRARKPVHWSEPHKAWLVTRYQDVAAGLVDRRLSSDRVTPMLEALPRAQRAEAGAVLEMLNGWMVLSDPPAHTRLRRLAAGAFKPQRVAAMEARIRRLVDGLLDDFVASGEQDLLAHFAYPLPATVIAELIGAPAEDRDRFKRWSSDLASVAFGAGGDERDQRHALALRGLGEMFGYFDELFVHAREAPGEDMISGLLEGDGQGDRLGPEELKAMCALMLFAGHETTTSTIVSAVLVLLEHPDQLRLARTRPQLLGSAVEELLRFEGPVKVLIRSVSENLELGGCEVKAGERVFLLTAAANRDPERFADPDGLDLARSPNSHLAFGRGVHACIGAQLARLELRIALAAVLRRLPGLRLAPGIERRWRPTLSARALEELRVEHDAGRR